MRWLIVLLFVSSAAAQGAGWSTTDPTGDPASDGTVPFPAEYAPMADILEVGVEEAADALSFWVTSASVPRPADTNSGVGSASFYIGFEVGGAPYTVYLYPVLFSDRIGGELRSGGPDDAGLVVQRLDPVLDGDTFRADVPRELLRDADGQTVNPLTPVTGVHALSRSQIRPGLDDESRLNGVADRAPDSEADDGTFVPMFGLEQSGPLSLQSPRPFRASNGLATTFAIQVNLTDARAGGDEVSVTLDALEVPSGWSVQIIPDVLLSTPGKVQDLVVLIGTPDRHLHGDQQVIPVQATGPDGWRTVLDVGVTFVDPPLPSGHHPDLYVHSRDYSAMITTNEDRYFPRNLGFLSTSLDDERDTGEPVQLLDYCPVHGDDPLASCYGMTSWLPVADLGLVREEAPARVTGTVTFPDPVPVASDVQARFLVSWADEWDRYDGLSEDAQPLWDSDWVPLTLSGASAAFDEALAFVDGPLRYEAQDGGRLYLQVMVESVSPTGIYYNDPGAGDITLEPGARLTLPLGEYHDLLAEVVGKQGFHIQAPPRVAVATDVVTSVEFEVHDKTSTAEGLEVVIGGPAASWVVEGPVVSFKDGTGNVRIDLLAADGAVGQHSSLAIAVRDPTTGLTGATTLPIDVVPSSEVTPVDAETQASPSPLPLVPLALAALLRRRTG